MVGRARLGLIVNPIAGMGGSVGLKGTDSAEILQEARSRGAVGRAPQRAAEALRVIAASLGDGAEFVAAAGEMGEQVARAVGLPVSVVPGGRSGATTAADTERAAAEMAASGVIMILFAGGDGTARNLHSAIGEALPTVGIPAGVKMHSAVYATTPHAAGELTVRFLRDGLPVRAVEIMDIDEQAYRSGAVAARLYGFLSMPFHRDLVQGVKSGWVNSDFAALEAIASEIEERLEPDRLYVLGPGTTVRAIARRLGLEKTLLGVDLLCNRRMICLDVGEPALLAAVKGRRVSVIVTPIGGQGHFLGRGNQQISPTVLRRVSREDIIVVATPQKLASLAGRPLRVDTGDSALDRALCGYVRVVTGYHTEAICPVSD